MDQNFDIQAYMTRGVERVVSDAIKATIKNPRESAFMVRFAAESRAASKRRAESCPFSPYSDVNIRDKSLKQAMNSKLFTALRSGDLLADDHKGGCVLYERREQVQALLS